MGADGDTRGEGGGMVWCWARPWAAPSRTPCLGPGGRRARSLRHWGAGPPSFGAGWGEGGGYLARMGGGGGVLGAGWGEGGGGAWCGWGEGGGVLGAQVWAEGRLGRSCLPNGAHKCSLEGPWPFP